MSAGLPAPGSAFENLAADGSLDPAVKHVALTFDDGPTQYTRPIFEILKNAGVPATFFMLSDQVQANADLVREMTAAGMQIGSHSRNHPHLPGVDVWGQRDQIGGSTQVINSVAGPGAVSCFRPPYGEADAVTQQVVTENGLAIAKWSVDTRDWQKPPFTTIIQRVQSSVRDRSVVLMHDGGGDRTATIAALPWVIQWLKDQGYQFVSLC